MKKNKMDKTQFVDANGNAWSDSMGDLKVGSKFILYGDQLCEVKSIEEGVGPGGVTYLWGDREHHGLPPIKVGEAWCEEG